MLTELGLGCPTHDNLKGTFGVDLGHAAFHWTVDFRYERMQPDPARLLYLYLQTHGLVQALERCIPVSPSKVKVLLKVTTSHLASATTLSMHSTLMSKGASAVGQMWRQDQDISAAGLVYMLNRVLQHVEGVLLLRLVHSELGTPVLPDWDKLRLVRAEPVRRSEVRFCSSWGACCS